MAYTAIDDPSAYYQTALWTGDGNSTKAVTFDGNSDLKPDLFWAKVRNHTYNHILLDTTRGFRQKRVISNSTDAEDSHDYFMTSNDSDGFTTDDDVNTNELNKTYIAWCWKANDGTSNASAAESGSNNGYNFQVNTTSKFMINAYTGIGSNSSLQLGNHFTPQFLMIKNRSQADAWAVYHHKMSADPDTDYLVLDTTAAVADDDTYWVDANFAADEISLGTNHSVNADGENYICYAWAGVQGYSKFNSYVGTGSTAGGPFIYLGFKPSFLMIKRTDSATNGNWWIKDSARDPLNDLTTSWVRADLTAASDPGWSGPGSNGGDIQFFSNGFDIQGNWNGLNGDGATYVYAAFAHQPFVTSEGVPCTAR